MPELPEVETVKRGLSQFLAGRKILSVKKNRPDLRWPIPASLEHDLTGARILKLERRGKYILWHTQDEMVMVLHLGMSGRVLITKDLPKVKDAHDHLTFKTEDGFFIRYNDPRRFGFVDIVPLKKLAKYPSLAALGPEPLSNAFNASALRQKINKKQSSIKSVLLDQTIIAGLGFGGRYPGCPARCYKCWWVHFKRSSSNEWRDGVFSTPISSLFSRRGRMYEKVLFGDDKTYYSIRKIHVFLW